jgi:hypothetical protein
VYNATQTACLVWRVTSVALENERKKKRNRATTKNTNQHFYTQAHSITTVAQSNKHDHTSVPHKDE